MLQASLRSDRLPHVPPGDRRSRLASGGDGLRLEHRDGAVLVISRWAAPGASATTLGRFVFVRERAVDSPRLIRHELVHVRQWRRFGVVGFGLRYLGAYLRWRARRYPHWAAYRRVPLEIEADWESRAG